MDPTAASIERDPCDLLRSALRAAIVAATCTLTGALASGPGALWVLGASHPQPAWQDARTFAANYRGIQTLPYFLGFLLVAGFVVCTLPPILTWAIGYHVMKINPAILMGGVAGARAHRGPAREAAKEIGSSVPWIGFPVGYAVSGILLTVFGYVAMILSK